MKLIIQIPCYNEEADLPGALAAIPRQVPGFRSVEVLVIDDGSTDRTAEVARTHGADHVVRHQRNQGLARAFMTGLQACIDRGADVIVNTDADNQYDAACIPALTRPILDEGADMVIGARPIATIRHFSPSKRVLQRLGSAVVRGVSKTDVQDAPSGFRAMTRDAALRLNVFSAYTYTLETLIQAGRSNLKIANVAIGVNGPTRPSRLVRSVPSYVRRSISAMLGTYIIYRPTKFFGVLSALFLAPAMVLALRYVYLAWIAGTEPGRHIPSVIAAGVLGLCGVFMLAIGALAHLLAINRRLLEELRYLTRSGRAGSAARPGGAADERQVEVRLPGRTPRDREVTRV